MVFVLAPVAEERLVADWVGLGVLKRARNHFSVVEEQAYIYRDRHQKLA